MVDIARAASERMARRKETMRLYQPLPFQERFHACKSRECMLRKANRAGGPTPISTPVLTPDGWIPIGELNVGDTVIGGDGLPCKVTKVMDQGWLPVYRMTFDDGASVCCSADHHWRCKLTKNERFPSSPYYKDGWNVYSLDEIRRHGGDEPIPRDRAVIPLAECQFPHKDVPLDAYTLGVILGDGSVSQQSVMFCTEDAEIAEMVSEAISTTGAEVRERSTGGYKGKASTYGIVSAVQERDERGCPKANPAQLAIRELGLMGKRGEEKFIPERYLFNSVDVRRELLRGLMDTDGTADKCGHTYLYTNSPQLAEDAVKLVRSLGGKASVTWKETSIVVKEKRKGRKPRREALGQQTLRLRKQCLNMAIIHVDTEFCPFRLERKAERWRARQDKRRHVHGRFLERIEPAGNAPCRCITVDNDEHTYVTRDYIVTHNSIAGFTEDARAVLGLDPHGKYPAKGTLVCIGYGQSHIGTIIYRHLFQPGLFKIIRTSKQEGWRIFRPWEQDREINGKKGDLGLEDQAEPSPPLIPEKYIKEDFAWDDRRARVFSRVVIETPNTEWEIRAYNSNGDPRQAQGFNANLVHIDEDLADAEWYIEMVARTNAVQGLLRWTALPHEDNDAMKLMEERAEEDAGDENPRTVIFTASATDNPFYSDKEKQQDARLWKQMGEDVYRQRFLGEYTNSGRMYPTFSVDLHTAISELEGRSKVQEIVTDGGGVIPHEWCRYAAVDPGHAVCAVLYFAVPPPDVGDQVVIYDELYLRGCDAKMFAAAHAEKARGITLQDFIIDAHGGRLREIGSGVTPREQYSSQLRKQGMRSVASGYDFRDGSDNIKGRETILREWLGVREDGTTRLLVIPERCPEFCREMVRFRKKKLKIGGQATFIDEGERRTNTHAIEACEYGVAMGLPYVKPPRKRNEKTFYERVIEGRRARAARRRAKAENKGIVLGARGA